VDHIALGEQKLGQVRAVLTRDAGDESYLGHEIGLAEKGQFIVMGGTAW
jgi:hypothetical protein